MSQLVKDIAPDSQGLISEDETPVDHWPSEKQQRLLIEPLYSSWAGPGAGRSFVAAANVGVFARARNPAIVPDMFLSLDVQVPDDWWERRHCSYFLWEFGKPPELVLEIVSNTEGGEDWVKKQKYARMRASYYVIYDPQLQIMADVITVYRIRGIAYERQASPQFADLNLGLALWDGTFEDKQDMWLRWTDVDGVILPTGKERAEQEHQRAEREHQRAEQEHQRAEQTQQQLAQEQQRMEHLLALLRQAGIDPDAAADSSA